MPKVKKFLVLLLMSVLCLCAAAAASAHTSSTADQGWKCQRFTVTRPVQKSVFFSSVLYHIDLVASVCWNGQIVQSEGTVCNVLEQDHFTIQISPCSTVGYYYQLTSNPPSDPHSAYRAQASFVISNCFWRYACWATTTITLGLYVNMNGQYVPDDGR
jgi:hypothetical protein